MPNGNFDWKNWKDWIDYKNYVNYAKSIKLEDHETWLPLVIPVLALSIFQTMNLFVFQTDFSDGIPVNALLYLPFKFVQIVFVIAVLAIVLRIYLLPTVIANRRNQENKATISRLNLFLGWTALFWLVCLLWAVVGDKAEPEENIEALKRCPECAEMILVEAVKCKHCGYRYVSDESETAPIESQ